jgi:NitT/TauT family transport system permease protein
VGEAAASPLGARVTRRIIDTLLLILLLLVVWEVLHRLVGRYALSSPFETVQYLFAFFGQPVFLPNAQATLLAIFYATVIAFGAGLAIGLPLGLFRGAGDVADPFLIALFSIPKITLYPVILLIFGLTFVGKVAFGAIHGIFPVILFALSGVRSIRPVYLKSARTFNLSTFNAIRLVLLPAALPEIVTGLRVGFASTILGTLIGEMFAGTEGLGFVLFKAIDRNNVPLIMALTLLFFVVSSAANAVLLAVDHRLHRRANPPGS